MRGRGCLFRGWRRARTTGGGTYTFRRLCFTGPAPDLAHSGGPQRSSRPHGLVGRLRRDGSGRTGSLFGRYLQRQPHRTRRPGAAPSRRLVSKRDRRELLRLWLPARPRLAPPGSEAGRDSLHSRYSGRQPAAGRGSATGGSTPAKQKRIDSQGRPAAMASPFLCSPFNTGLPAPAAGAASPSLKGLHKRGEAIAAGRPGCLSVLLTRCGSTGGAAPPGGGLPASCCARQWQSLCSQPPGCLAGWLLVSGKKSPELWEPWEHR